jgi:hypothetical protein
MGECSRRGLKRVKHAPPPPSPPSPSEDESESESESESSLNIEVLHHDSPQRAPRFCKQEGCRRRFTIALPRVLFARCGHTIYCTVCARALVTAAGLAGDEPKCPHCEQPLDDYYEVDFVPSGEIVSSEHTSSPSEPSSPPTLVLSQADTIHADQADSEDIHGSASATSRTILPPGLGSHRTSTRGKAPTSD